MWKIVSGSASDPISALLKPVARLLGYGHAWRLRSYVLSHIVSRVPPITPRLWMMERLGVKFEDRRASTVLLGAHVWFPDRITIGTDAVIGRECRFDAGGGIIIGRTANLSHGVRLQTGRHDLDGADFEAVDEPINIGDYTWICGSAIVIGRVSIGERAVVMAGAVVSRDVPPWTIVGAVPARPVRNRARADYTLDWRPDFN